MLNLRDGGGGVVVGEAGFEEETFGLIELKDLFGFCPVVIDPAPHLALDFIATRLLFQLFQRLHPAFLHLPLLQLQLQIALKPNLRVLPAQSLKLAGVAYVAGEVVDQVFPGAVENDHFLEHFEDE